MCVVTCKLHKLSIWDGGGVASHDLQIIKKALAIEVYKVMIVSKISKTLVIFSLYSVKHHYIQLSVKFKVFCFFAFIVPLSQFFH